MALTKYSIGLQGSGFFTLPGFPQEAPRPVAARNAIGTPAAASGVSLGGGFADAKRIALSMIYNGTSAADREATWDSIVNACPIGDPRQLVLEQTDRFFWVIPESLDPSTQVSAPFQIRYTLNLLAYYGFAEAENSTTVALTAGGGGTYSTDVYAALIGSNEPARPIITLDVTTIGQIDVVNSLTGDLVRVQASAIGTLVIDCRKEQLTRGGLDVTTEWTAGEWFKLFPGGHNVITVTPSGGAVIGSASIDFRPLWR